MFKSSIKKISPDIDQWAYFKLDGVYIHIGLKPLPNTEDRHYEQL